MAGQMLGKKGTTKTVEVKGGDVAPVLLDQIDRDLPGIDDPTLWGELVFRLSINRFGKATKVTVVRSSLPKVVEGEILLRFYAANYRPGEKNETPVDSALEFHVQIGEVQPKQ